MCVYVHIHACSTYGRGEIYTGFWWGNVCADPGVDGRIILKCNFRKWDVAHGLDSYGSGQGLATGTCNAVMNGTSVSIKCGDFLTT